MCTFPFSFLCTEISPKVKARATATCHRAFCGRENRAAPFGLGKLLNSLCEEKAPLPQEGAPHTSVHDFLLLKGLPSLFPQNRSSFMP